MKKHLGLPNVSVHIPLTYNHLFKPGLMDEVFLDWRDRGIHTVADLYINGKFASFFELQSTYHLPQSHFYRYLQVRNFVHECIPEFTIEPEKQTFYDLLLSPSDSKQLISRFTSTFAKPASTHHLKEAWEKELGINISEELWEDSLANIQNCSINSRYRLIQFKVVHRSHYSKTKLSKIFESVLPTCDRCETAEGSLSHLFWQCSVLNNFWSNIFHWSKTAV